jgi:hypothetical protein
MFGGYMNRFIRLTTHPESKTVYINPNDVSIFFKHGAFTDLEFISNKYTLKVKEPPEQIMKLIKEK